jgi:hypothetical protein
LAQSLGAKEEASTGELNSAFIGGIALGPNGTSQQGYVVVSAQIYEAGTYPDGTNMTCDALLTLCCAVISVSADTGSIMGKTVLAGGCFNDQPTYSADGDRVYVPTATLIGILDAGALVAPVIGLVNYPRMTRVSEFAGFLYASGGSVVLKCDISSGEVLKAVNISTDIDNVKIKTLAPGFTASVEDSIVIGMDVDGSVIAINGTNVATIKPSAVRGPVGFMFSRAPRSFADMFQHVAKTGRPSYALQRRPRNDLDW